MGAWKNCVLSAGKPHAHNMPRFRGGGVFWVGVGGGSANFTFMGARIFLIKFELSFYLVCYHLDPLWAGV